MGVGAPSARAAVVGAGIGGLAAVAALCRQGITVDVHEQAPELRDVGMGLHLGSNGTGCCTGWAWLGRCVSTGAPR